MGPTLARLAVRAVAAGGGRRRVIGVSRFSEAGLERRLREFGVETIATDLLADGALDRLPDAPNVIFMAGRKFGSTGDEGLTWAMNVYLPGLVARHYRGARLVVFSTGNVYPLVPVESGGATENTPPAPIGEYAQSCLGRERVVACFAARDRTPVAIIRLNYAIDLRYGVLLDVARRVWAHEPVDLTMGHVNVIWQGDANRAVLRALPLATCPPLVLNLTGPETVSIRQVAREFATLLDRPEPVFRGAEAPTALLSDAARAQALLGAPTVPPDRMLRWVANWVRSAGRTYDKPTHFEVRDGRF
jgi:nucleoside-diphosphate-sugar epimerase